MRIMLDRLALSDVARLVLHPHLSRRLAVASAVSPGICNSVRDYERVAGAL